MTTLEDQIWDRFNSNKPILVDENWLEEVYSLDLSSELRFTIGERLGLLSDKGWEVIKTLIHKYGYQYELIYASGLCHQIEARDLLLKLFRDHNKLDLTVVRALACWGAILEIHELKMILRQDSMQMRLAGLDLLSFKAHLLNANELLELVGDLLDDFREEVVIKVIQTLQRRDEDQIINCITKIACSKMDKIVEIALIALGSIGTSRSVFALSQLSRELPNKIHREIAQKQIAHQYINFQ